MHSSIKTLSTSSNVVSDAPSPKGEGWGGHGIRTCREGGGSSRLLPVSGLGKRRNFHFSRPPTTGRRSALHRPARTIFLLQELIRFRQIAEGELLRVPEQSHLGQFLAQLRAQGDVAQQHGFGQRSGPIEVRARRRAALARFNPLDIMPRRTFQLLWWFAVIGLQLLRVETPFALVV